MCRYSSGTLSSALGLRDFAVVWFVLAAFPAAGSEPGPGLGVLVAAAIERSEELLYAADLDAALGELRLERFAGAEPLPESCRIDLAAQTAKVQIFRSILAGTPERDEQTLDELLVFSSTADGVTDPALRARFLLVLGKAYLHGRHRDAARRSYSAAAALFEEVGDLRNGAAAHAFALMVEHLKRRAAGDPAKVAELIPAYEAEIERSARVGSRLALAYNLRHFGRIYLETLDQPGKALEPYRRSLELREEIGFRVLLPASYFSLGTIYGRLGRADEAREMLGRSFELADEIGFVRYRFLARMKLGELHQENGEASAASGFYRQALRVAEEDGRKAGVEQALVKLREIP